MSEARQQLSRLVTGVSRGGTAITITQHGKERAALVGIQEYQKLSQKAQAFDRSRQASRPFTVRGSLELLCSVEKLEAEMTRIRGKWAEAVHRSAAELAGELSQT